MSKTIVLAASLAQRPFHGGHAWVFLQYLLGFRRLGWDVLFLDQLQPEMCVDDAGQPCSLYRSHNLECLLKVMERYGLKGSFSLMGSPRQPVVGLTRQRVIERVKASAALINVMGYLRDERILNVAPRRIFLDIDPGFGQMWRELGLADVFAGHDEYVTIGENIGQPHCLIPTCGLKWTTTRPPVVLEHWPSVASRSRPGFTSVVSWRGPFGPIEYRGHTYGLRVHEFRKFAATPSLAGVPFELALDIDPCEARDLDMLQKNGWSLVDPTAVAGNPWAYQEYVQQSPAEFMVAKNLYVETNSAWFSDRSVCYLASGKPVLAQDTGWRAIYGTDCGLLAFRTLEEAVCGAEELRRNYDRHARAARAVAEEHFDSDVVLGRLLSEWGLA